MAASRLTAWCVIVATAVTPSCKHEDDGADAQTPPAYGQGAPAPPGQYVPPQNGPAGPPGAAPGAPGPAPSTQAAVGIPCQSDGDLQCPFGRCVAGRCGGCATGTDCKSGSTCAWTPFGMACVLAPGAFPMPTAAGPAAPSPSPPVAGGAPASGDGLEAARRLCVDRTNEFRARVGAPPVSRNSGQESCNDAQAKSDGVTSAIHGAFGRCNESAQNECPSWPGPPESAIGPCLQQMFDEGPGSYADHGHYINMTNRRYTSVSCGIYTTPGGKVWVVQDFY